MSQEILNILAAYFIEKDTLENIDLNIALRFCFKYPIKLFIFETLELYVI